MTERKFKLNVIDILILLVLIVAIGFLAYIFVLSDNTEVEGEKHTVEYVVEISGINAELFSGKLKEGNIITSDDGKKTVIGVVSKPPQELQKYEPSYSNTEGKEVYSPVENSLDIVLTFTTETEKNEWGYCIADGTYLPVNTTINMIIGDLRCTGYCVELNVID